MDRARVVTLAAIGAAAGLASGLFGVGGGVVMVPLLAVTLGYGQHRAHATSLAAVVPIALAGAVTFAASDEIDLPIALALAAGGLLGVPIGARVMRAMDESGLRIAFGVFMVLVGGAMVWR